MFIRSAAVAALLVLLCLFAALTTAWQEQRCYAEGGNPTNVGFGVIECNQPGTP